MCGRIACLLGPETLVCACSYLDPTSNTYKKPVWRDHPPTTDSNSPDGVSNHSYYPSANIPPTRCTPILFQEAGNEDRIVQPMIWSMIPIWHKGLPTKHSFSTNNARIETLTESKLYRRALNARNFCVVLAQGFYEWKTVGHDPKKSKVKQPYLIYAPQPEELESKVVKAKKIAADGVWEADWSEEGGWSGPKLLMMAGLYDTWKNDLGEVVYSYTVITMESNKTLSWLHHRMPAILETPEEVEAWINPDPEKSVQELLKMLKPVDKLEWYTVNTKVNNSRCHDLDCAQYFEIKENKGSTFMSNWLKKAAPKDEKAEEADSEEPDEKKVKVEK